MGISKTLSPYPVQHCQSFVNPMIQYKMKGFVNTQSQLKSRVQTGCLIFKVFLKFNFVPPLLGVWDQNLTLCINLEAIHFKSTGRPSLLSPASDQNP